jgi:hypothetical protein
MGCSESKQQKICKEHGMIIDKKFMELLFEEIKMEGKNRGINVGNYKLIGEDCNGNPYICLNSNIDKFKNNPLIKIPCSENYPRHHLSTYPYYLNGMNNCELLNVVYCMSEQDPQDDFWLNHDNSNAEIVDILAEEKVGQLIIKDYYDIIEKHIDIENKYYNKNKGLGKEQKINRQLQIDDSFNKILELSSNDRTDLAVKKVSKIVLDKYQEIYDYIIDAMTYKLVD